MLKLTLYAVCINFMALLFTACKKSDLKLSNEVGQPQEILFKNAAAAPPGFEADAEFIKNHLSGTHPFATGANGQFVWERMGAIGNSRLVVLPFTLNNGYGGFLLLNKNTPVPAVEWYYFGKNFVKGSHALHSKDAFLVNILLNKIINGIVTYDFASVNDMPYLFRKFTKMDEQPVKPKPGDRITVHIETPVDNMTAMSYPVCQTMICDWVETPNFQWQYVCWYQQGCNDPDPWGPFGGSDIYNDPYGSPPGGGGGDVAFDAMVNSVTAELGLTDQHMVAIYQEDPLTFVELYYYLQHSTQPEKKGIARAHLDAMAFQQIPPDTFYRNFSWRHRAAANNNFLWFEDEAWLDDPGNFNLDIDYQGGQYKLTRAEKVLIAAFPIQALIIKNNIDNAFEMTAARLGGGIAINDKKDAFRHAYFNAINTRSCPYSIFPPLSAEQIVRLFADAHESEVPAVLMLEKQMDLFNNNVGINYASWLFWTSDNTVANAIMNKLNNGELRYIKPLDLNLSKAYDGNRDGIQDCSTCLNGILPSSIITPTNQ